MRSEPMTRPPLLPKSIAALNLRDRPSLSWSSSLVGVLVLGAVVWPGTAAAHQPSAEPEPPVPVEPEVHEAFLPPADAQSVSGPLRITVAPELENAALLPSWIRERNPGVKDVLALEGHEQWVDIDVAGTTYDYRVTIVPMRDGQRLGPRAQADRCECSDQELLENIDVRIAAAVATIESTPLPVEPEPVEPEPAELEPVEPEPVEPKRLTSLGIGGIVSGVVGLGLVGGGVALLVADDRSPAVDRRFFLNDQRPPGFALLSVGIAAAGAGAAMLALDLTRCRRRADAKGCSQEDDGARPSGVSARSRIVPGFGPQTATIAVVGRF